MKARFILPVLLLIAGTALAQQTIVKEDFTFASSLDGTGPLGAAVVYPESPQKLPMMVVQHGYFGNRGNVLFSANRMAERGYFCLCIDTRGWGDSAGAHDDGGIEIMDIYDGIQAAIAKYGDKLDDSRISIVGYSNGGANVFFATVRFPYLFRAAMAFFGISDYGMWVKLQGNFREPVIKAIGGTPEEVPDKYLARSAVLAAGNLAGTRFHIAYDETENLCPIPMNDAFVEATKHAGYKDIFVHVSKAADKNRWIHGYNGGHLSPIEDVFMDDVEKANPSRPAMPATGELTVIGFVVTPRFQCVLGSGDDAVAKMKFDLRDGAAKFAFSPISSNKQAKARVTLCQDAADCDVEVVAGQTRSTLAKGSRLEAETTIDSTLEFREKKP